MEKISLLLMAIIEGLYFLYHIFLLMQIYKYKKLTGSFFKCSGYYGMFWHLKNCSMIFLILQIKHYFITFHIEPSYVLFYKYEMTAYLFWEYYDKKRTSYLTTKLLNIQFSIWYLDYVSIFFGLLVVFCPKADTIPRNLYYHHFITFSTLPFSNLSSILC